MGGGGLETVRCREGGNTGGEAVVVVADGGNEGYCAALRWATPGRQSRHQGPRVGGQRWVDDGLEIAVAGVRRLNP